MNVTATNKTTGETIELNTDSLDELVIAYQTAKSYSDFADDIKNQLKKIIPTYLDENGKSPLSEDGYQFKQYETQRTTYDKSVLRDLFDEDEMDVFLQVSKSKVDAYIKLHKDTMGSDELNHLKGGLIPDGAVSKTTRLDKVA